MLPQTEHNAKPYLVDEAGVNDVRTGLTHGHLAAGHKEAPLPAAFRGIDEPEVH
jgi:hypothetical protein